MTHPGYTEFAYRNHPHYKCAQCPFDSADLGRMEQHRNGTHGSLHIEYPDYGIPLEDWAIEERASHSEWCKGLKVALGFITWNQREAHVLGAEALVRERDRLNAMGMDATICWVDNGSTDGTWEAVRPLINDPFLGWRSNRNHGSGDARNLILDMGKALHADYFLMLDGDIEVIPYSTYAMMRLLHTRSDDIVSIGMDSSNCSPEVTEKTAKDCRAIYPWMAANHGYTTAWTQYGMWKFGAIRDLRFETGGPFGPGWGLEDDDFYLQLAIKGYEQLVTRYFAYIHRRLHSSIPILGREFVIANFNERRKYLLKKWQPYKASNRKVALCLGKVLGMRIDSLVQNTE